MPPVQLMQMLVKVRILATGESATIRQPCFSAGTFKIGNPSAIYLRCKSSVYLPISAFELN
jgi:hypothetical protein